MSPDAPVVYVLGTFPQPSQTFIAREVRGLLRRGVHMSVFALARRSRDILEPEDRAWYEQVHFVPATLWPSVIAANIGFLTRQPRRYLTTLRMLVGLRHSPRLLAGRAVSLFIRSAWIAREIEGQGGCRLVHGHFALAQTEVAMAVAGLLGCRFSFTAHARDIYASPSALEAKIRAAAFVVSCTRSGADYLRTLCPDVDPGRIHLAHHGIDDTILAARLTSTAGSSGPTILAAGRLVEKKGFDTLIDACALLKRRGVAFECRLRGEGPDRARLHRQIRQEGLDGRVALAGWATPSELLEEMQRATVFAMPSRLTPDGDRDGLPNVVLEAMACGLPVVATSVSGIPEAIADRQTGLLVEPNDPNALADALELLLGNPGLRADLGRAAADRVRREFTLDVACGRLAALFDQIAPAPNDRRADREPHRPRSG